jgi:RNA polymerase sigma factor (sigma-70 family)
VARRKQLTAEHERALVIAAGAGDPEGSRLVVEAFLPSIAGIARRFPSDGGVERQELIQEGVAGLLLATKRYDSARDTPFWAYASFWVRKAMQELVARVTRPVALSDRAVRGLAQIKAAQRTHLQAHGVEPTKSELSAATGLTRDQIEALRATERIPRGMEEPLGADASSTVGDTVVDPVAERAYEQVLDRIEARAVRVLADELDGRERAVLHAHYGLGRTPETLDQIGGELGLTAERARQIEAGALTKLRLLCHSA